MMNKNLFQKYIAGLCELHRIELSKIAVEMYWHALTPFSDTQCKAAFDKAVVKYKFFPKPAELIELIEAPKQYLAQQQVVYFMNAVTGRNYRNPEGWDDDPTTQRLLQGRFNVERVREESLESDHKWIEKDFIQAYNDCTDYCELDEKIKIEMSPEVKKLTENIG